MQISYRKRGTKWEYRFEIAKLDNKRTFITKCGFTTKKAAVEAGQKAWEEYHDSGQNFKPTELSVSDYLKYWIENYCKTNLKDTTIKTYEKKIRLYIEPDIGKYYLKSLTPSVLQQLINKRFNEGLSRNTLSVLKGILSNSLAYAVEPCKFIKQNPMAFVKLPLKRAVPESPANKKDRRPVTDDEWEQIIERFPEGEPSHIPLVLAYRCGLRLGEVFGLTWEDIDFDNSTLSVSRQVQYSDSNKAWIITSPKYDSCRTISLDSNTLALLKRTKEKLQKAKDYYAEHYIQLCLEGNKISSHGEPINLVCTRDSGEYIQPRIMQHVGRVIHGKNNKNSAPISEDWDFHSLRHTHATKLLEAGVPYPLIQQRLGHTKISMTERYVHATTAMEDKLKSTLCDIF